MWHGKVLEFMNPLDVGATSAWVVLGPRQGVFGVALDGVEIHDRCGSRSIIVGAGGARVYQAAHTVPFVFPGGARDRGVVARQQCLQHASCVTGTLV